MVGFTATWFLGRYVDASGKPQVLPSSDRGHFQAELHAAQVTAAGLPLGERAPAQCSVLPVCAAVWCGVQ